MLKSTQNHRWTKEIFHIYASTAPIGMYIVQNGVFRMVNHSFEKITGFNENELIGQESLSLVIPKYRDQLSDSAVSMLKGIRREAYQYEVTAKDGSRKWIMESVVSIKFEDNRKAALGYFMDISEQKQTEEDLWKAANKDPLTDLHNLRGLLHLGEQKWKELKRMQGDVIVFVMDLDGLKEINDTLGHAAGNQAIISMAKVLRDSFRDSDLLARTGGDEFAVVLFDVEAAHIQEYVDRVYKTIVSVNSINGKEFVLSASIGVAFCPAEKPITLAALMSIADQEMQDCKDEKKKLQQAC
jgi:diguanylate cyclase (GGDEF)-like protein/PAS domain S-box-containing protein